MKSQAGNPRVSACEGKTTYCSFDEAKRIAKRMNRKHDGALDVVGPYRCHYCRQIHLGTAATREPRRRDRNLDQDITP